ncbi:MAG: prenyltransferase/squalene oxidase repeat-containing protein [Pirellulales bacterium]
MRKCDSAFEQSLVSAWLKSRAHLAAEQFPSGHWTGGLSTSALSTATAVSALSIVRSEALAAQACNPIFDRRRTEIEMAIDVGCRWLIEAQNSDGGFGDTDLSHSNIATSYLVPAAWHLAGYQEQAGDALQRATAYCERLGSWDGLRRRYGVDKTFVVPILTNCALAGLADWRSIPALPFEAAWLPQRYYRWARMPVVSYAVPALVAIGQARFFKLPPRNLLIRALRRAAVGPTLDVLASMQPTSGGYLEAVPLTSFVLMSLAGTGRGTHPVAQHAIKFLLKLRLSDGSWPIDENLATWTTSLSITALARGAEHAQEVYRAQDTDRLHAARETTDTPSIKVNGVHAITTEEWNPVESGRAAVTAQTMRWLLSCQHLAPHPFTGAQPGGWGWTDLSGAVPDADDTPAALLAMAQWLDRNSATSPIMEMQMGRAAALGLRWLLDLQNRDGGWPTFCRGWGKLPFDRSGSDLTAHAIRAIHAWKRHWDLAAREDVCPSVQRLERATARGFLYLSRTQNRDGSWNPLWFGNQDRPEEDNPFYGTGKVLMAYAEVGSATVRDQQAQLRGIEFLRGNQNDDGGWGGGPSVPYRVTIPCAESSIARSSLSVGSCVEETAIVLEALLAAKTPPGGSSQVAGDATIMRGLRWLAAAVEQGCLKTSWPIGFYFAKLWYHERLYPPITATAALGSAVQKWFAESASETSV